MVHRPRLRAAAAGAAVGALLLAACSVSSSDSGDDAGADDAASDDATSDVTSDAPTHGITDDTIRIGAATIDVDAVRDQFGVDLGQLPPEVLPALVEAVNEDGGINGRQVELVERRYMPIGTEDSERVCRELTEDEQVFAVAGTFLGDNSLCVTETYSTPYIGLWGLSEERRERSNAPFIAMESGAEQRLEAAVAGMVDDGVVDDSSVAVYFDSETPQSIIDANVIAPLEDAGVEVVSNAQLPASGDAVQAASDIDRIFQRFEADGADTVLAVSGAAVIFPALERTDWAPQLVFTNGQVIGDGAIEDFGLSDPAELEGAVAYVPNVTTDELADDPALDECFATINERTDLALTDDDLYPAEERPGSREVSQVTLVCQLWDLTVAVLTAAGDDPSPQSLIDGLADLDELALPGYPELSLSPDQWGAQGDMTRRWTFDAGENLFVPDGPLTGADGG